MKMTSTKLIGRETMISRLIDFHNKRISRVYAEWPERRDSMLSHYSYDTYRPMSTRSICKEYDDTFGVVPLTGQEEYEIRLTAQNR